MIAKGSSDEAEAQRYVSLWHAMIRQWNVEADSYRDAARGRLYPSPDLLEEAERTHASVMQAIELSDVVGGNLPPGHELVAEVLRVTSALEALASSIAVSIEQLIPRVEETREVARLKFLVSAIKPASAASA